MPSTRTPHTRLTNHKNRLFKKLTAGQKRVLIAKDALSQIKAKKFIPTSGTYVSFCRDIHDHRMVQRPWESPRISESQDEQLQDILLRSSVPKCEVCARGALFLSTVRKFNSCTLNELNGGKSRFYPSMHGFSQVERTYFSPAQTRLIERTFESHAEYPDLNDEDRLMSILKNIIRNQGTFRPTRLP